MKKITLLLSFFSFSILLIGQSATFMSYNIRMDTPNDSLNAWPHRKAFLLNQIQFYQPDVIGTQEGFLHQLAYLNNGLTSHTYVGVARDDGKTKGEYTAIFYNKDRFDLLKEGTFWLSSTPDTVGLGWDAVCNRTCTYILIKQKDTGQRYWVFNTHFDHVGKVARAEASKLILEKIKTYASDNEPIILLGDFNVEPTDPVYDLLTSQLSDSWAVSQQTPFGNEGTFNGFKFNQPLTRRIDYIFVNHQQVTVEKYATLSDSKNCRYPSDHLPVFVKIALKK